MIFKYSKILSSGPYGKIIQHSQTEDEDITTLGEIDGETYIHTKYKKHLTGQPRELTFEQVTLTPELKAELKRQAPVQLTKETLRTKIEAEAGDLHDLLADCMKMIEFNMVLTSRLAADYFGTQALSEEQKEVYKHRNQALLDQIDSGDIKLRGSLEDINELMAGLMQRYGRIQCLVESDYINKLKEIDLK